VNLANEVGAALTRGLEDQAVGVKMLVLKLVDMSMFRRDDDGVGVHSHVGQGEI
jgi:hypothetical protein